MMKLIAALAAALLACAPAAAQNVAKLPAAAALTGTERMPAVQGSGCATASAPCATVSISPAALAIYLAPTFQAKDADLDAIAALTTVDFGRQLLTKADAASVRSAIGVTATGADTTYLYRANNLSGLTNVATARSNLGLATVAATGLDTDLTGAAWTTYTPTITAGSGTVSAASGQGQYKKIGRIVFWQVTITITTNGTAAGGIFFTLPPFTPAGQTTGTVDRWTSAGGEEAVNGLMLRARVTAGQSTGYLVRYNNQHPGSDGAVLSAEGFYASL